MATYSTSSLDDCFAHCNTLPLCHAVYWSTNTCIPQNYRNGENNKADEFFTAGAGFYEKVFCPRVVNYKIFDVKA